jgi:hypothetical protein
MPPRPSDKPLKKVTLNLYEEDVRWAQEAIGLGWTETLRDHWHNYCYRNRPSAPRGDPDGR